MPTTRFQIVVGVDLSEYSDMVLQHALDQALRHERPTVHVATVVPDEHGFWHRPSEAELAEREADAGQRLGALVSRVFDEVMPADRRAEAAVRVHVRRGEPEEQLVELAAELWADLLVVGRFGHATSRRRGLHRIGSVADQLVQLAECPVLVVTPPREQSASAQQCRACVQVRAESDGEAWFCAEHQGERLPGMSALIGAATFSRGSQGSSGGGSMW